MQALLNQGGKDFWCFNGMIRTESDILSQYRIIFQVIDGGLKI